MRSVQSCLLVLLVTLLRLEASAGAEDELPAEGRVIVPALDVLNEPDAASFLTSRLRKGERVVVHERLDHGWLAIEPPAGSFSWIDQEAIDAVGSGPDRGGGPVEARVIAAKVSVRPGRAGARMPGPPGMSLVEGEIVRLLDRPSLSLRQGRMTRVWLAIEPPAGEVRYVREAGVRLLAPIPREDGVAGVPAGRRAGAPAPSRTRRLSSLVEPVALDRRLVQVGPTPTEGSLPAGLAAELAGIDALHRGLLRQPVAAWQLGPIRRRYEELLQREADPAARTALRARLARVERQEQFADSARTFETLLGRSQQRDRTLVLDSVRARTDAPDPTGTDPDDRAAYDAIGLLQPSSRQHEGQAVYALIAQDGSTAAYLAIPPGLEARTLVARRVGVHGRIRFDQALGAELIFVRELDALSEPF